jgi:transposase
MANIPQGRYTKEFREEAVNLVLEKNLGIKETAQSLSLPPSTLAYWIKIGKQGKLAEVGSNLRPLTDVEVENARLKKANAILKMENEFLKKAAAYFAKESQSGTR